MCSVDCQSQCVQKQTIHTCAVYGSATDGVHERRESSSGSGTRVHHCTLWTLDRLPRGEPRRVGLILLTRARPRLGPPPRASHRGKICDWWSFGGIRRNRRPARPVEAPTSRFDSRGCPADVHLRPRAEEAGRTSSTRLLQLAGVEQLSRAKNEIWYKG